MKVVPSEGAFSREEQPKTTDFVSGAESVINLRRRSFVRVIPTRGEPASVSRNIGSGGLNKRRKLNRATDAVCKLSYCDIGVLHRKPEACTERFGYMGVQAT